ncbi:MAG TPA: cupin-like domain-containing protein [Puia sp.]|jgi:histone arginine demethylase JMJD6|nr:cupin-like domain-containing protein [Puia sp.]
MNTSANFSPKSKSAIDEHFAIERRNNLSYEEFKKKYLLPRRPVVITDATAKWKASSWTPEWFRERYPDKMVSTDQGTMRMDAFIDAITRDSQEPGPFLREQPLKDVFPDLIDHVEPTPSYVLPNWLGGNYFVGPINERLNRESHIEVNFCGRRIFPYLHIDDLGVHAFITQHYGDKEFIVYPPDQEPYLYRENTDRFSQIKDVDNPDLERFPLFAKAKALRVVLHAGESVFMPCGWWHTTKVPGTSLSTVISISNSSNWPELVKYLEENSNHPRLAPLFSVYLRSFGFLKSYFN